MTPRTNTTKKPPNPIPSPPPSTSTSTCSQTCCTNPCIAGPSSLTHKRPASPTPPFTHYSSISNPCVGPARLRCAPLELHEYPRRERNGRVDKGKAKVEGVAMAGGRGRGRGEGGAHMMNYTGQRKKWSHDLVARMREDDGSSSRRNTASPAISPAPAQPHVAVAVASPASRRDSMEPEAQMPNVTTPLVTVLSPQPQLSPAQRQMQQDAKESSEKEGEKKESKSKLHHMKRIWSSLV
ncbi:hypothetical protein COCCADRAFT_23972 [Bipolaris zeicola 26-R-13]|uniref:Uncharacterized protein n=1 Tax=Cochliobolus carbonum (strain 26-R-13) TaxID=930089 RepID=W6YF32_COCC2|nr:uncharacterized protein COCCADRAFT_23972 [Bipolaris zeicola 26-R-13]EUC36228.1 hypothetical protein COCCADRAFT_23972 [Bipolaris zeicola 26-R-13]